MSFHFLSFSISTFDLETAFDHSFVQFLIAGVISPLTTNSVGVEDDDDDEQHGGASRFVRFDPSSAVHFFGQLSF